MIAVALLGSIYAAFVIVAATHTHGRVGLGGAPLFYDFSAFYEAGALAKSGQAVKAYDSAAMIATEQAAFPGSTLRLPWNYPPVFLLLLAPLAALPYAAAWVAWSGTTYGAFLLATRRLVERGRAWLLLLAPGAAVNLFFGQNGLLTTALMAGGVLALDRRPMLGGAILGLLIYKPQFAVLAPVLLLCVFNWKALFGAAASVAALTLASLAAFGLAPAMAFVELALHPATVVSSSSSDWRAVPTVATMARTLGLGAPVTSLCQWSVALAATIAAAFVWRSTRDPARRLGALAAATLLVAPYLRGYDLAVLILPAAALFGDAELRPRLLVLLVTGAAWALPAFAMFASGPVQLSPLAPIALMVLLTLQALRGSSPGAA
jgi:hypothetical protein